MSQSPKLSLDSGSSGLGLIPSTSSPRANSILISGLGDIQVQHTHTHTHIAYMTSHDGLTSGHVDRDFSLLYGHDPIFKFVPFQALNAPRSEAHVQMQ